MNPFADFFKRGPDAIRLSDWLENMSESFTEWGSRILSGDKSSQDMLSSVQAVYGKEIENLLYAL
jgi:hypothetical protein